MQKNRLIGLDVCRIIFTIMIIIHHILNDGNVLNSLSKNTISWSTLLMIDIICSCAVNGYGFISGYVGYDSIRQHKNHIVNLWFMVFFYSAFFTLISILFFHKDISPIELMRSFMPVMSSQYWYFTAYIPLYFLIPILNHGIRNLTINQEKQIVTIFLILFFILPVLTRNDPFNNRGFSFSWLLILYILGAISKKNMLLEKVKIQYAYISIILSTAILYFGAIIILKYPILENLNWLSYISPFYLLNALSIILIFIKKNIKYKQIILTISHSTFAIYIIHIQKFVHDSLILNKFSFLTKFNYFTLILNLFIYTFAIFSLCLMIDLIRKFLFKQFERLTKLI